MTKYALLKELQMYLSEIVEEDTERWGDEEPDVDPDIAYDQGWHSGFAHAIQKIEELLND